MVTVDGSASIDQVTTGTKVSGSLGSQSIVMEANSGLGTFRIADNVNEVINVTVADAGSLTDLATTIEAGNVVATQVVFVDEPEDFVLGNTSAIGLEI